MNKIKLFNHIMSHSLTVGLNIGILCGAALFAKDVYYEGLHAVTDSIADFIIYAVDNLQIKVSKKGETENA